MAAYPAVARSRAHATACVNSATWLSHSSLRTIWVLDIAHWQYHRDASRARD